MGLMNYQVRFSLSQHTEDSIMKVFSESGEWVATLPIILVEKIADDARQRILTPTRRVTLKGGHPFPQWAHCWTVEVEEIETAPGQIQRIAFPRSVQIPPITFEHRLITGDNTTEVIQHSPDKMEEPQLSPDKMEEPQHSPDQEE